MDFDNIIFQVDGGIATIIFNRPKALNALTTDSVIEFSRALDEILENEEIRVLILTGAGEQAFVAGADIVEISRYNTVTEAQTETGISRSTIAKVCNGKSKTAGGFLWERVA